MSLSPSRLPKSDNKSLIVLTFAFLNSLYQINYSNNNNWQLKEERERARAKIEVKEMENDCKNGKKIKIDIDYPEHSCTVLVFRRKVCTRKQRERAASRVTRDALPGPREPRSGRRMRCIAAHCSINFKSNFKRIQMVLAVAGKWANFEWLLIWNKREANTCKKTL